MQAWSFTNLAKSRVERWRFDDWDAEDAVSKPVTW